MRTGGGVAAVRTSDGCARPTCRGSRKPWLRARPRGWKKEGTAFESQPTYLENVTGRRVNPITVGGDYWTDIPFPIGIRGSYWIGTHERRPTARQPMGQVQGDGHKGTLTSVPFRISPETSFISFLIGGGGDVRSLKIELLVVTAPETYAAIPRVPPATGLGSELLRRDWWSVRRLDKSADYAIRITDDTPTGHINVDDIRFENNDPSTARLPDGRPALLRTTIDGREVWTDYDAPLWGAADLHTHPMSHLSMGGKLMHGAPDVGSQMPAGTIKQGASCNPAEIVSQSAGQALADCGATHGGWGVDNSCGDTIRAAVINILYDPDFTHKIKFPHEASCEPGQSMESGLCYAKCEAGFRGFGTLCIKECPAGFRDDGLACGKPDTAYGRGVGYLMQNDDQGKCERENPRGCEKIGLIWYSRCPAGYHGYGAVCTKDCPAGFGDVGLHCSKPAAYGRGVGYTGIGGDQKARCEADNPLGCEQCGIPWYPKCKAGFHEQLCATCFANCPAGMADVGLLCQKNGELGRGAGYLGHTDDLGACERDNPQGCERCGAPFFPKCQAGFHPFGCNVCSPDCPADMTDIGASCGKTGTYDRGIGQPPRSNAHGDHEHSGWPTMKWWPHWSSKAHQQMYVDWIRRAHEGGLNLLVALAVNNELLGEVVNGMPPKDDRASADQQLDEIRSFIGRHTDFMAEVRSAAEYRQAVKAGKLAVVVGVEVDNIGNFNVANPLLVADEGAVKREIQRLYNEKGVRYILPLHFADNVFGGVAVKGPLFNLSNRFARTRPLPIGVPFPPGGLYEVGTASDPAIDYRMQLYGGRSGEWSHGLQVAAGKVLVDTLSGIPFPPAFHAAECPVPVLGCVPQFRLLRSMVSPDSQWDRYQLVAGGQVNVRGLTPIGEAAIKEMMRLGMIIDIDHMSDRAATRTLEIAQEFDTRSTPATRGSARIPPDRPEGKEAVNENMRSPEQLTLLGSLGGMMGIGWASGDAASYLENYRFGMRRGGTETCTDDRLGVRTCAPKTPPAFSLGSDINGFEQMPKARPARTGGPQDEGLHYVDLDLMPAAKTASAVEYCDQGDDAVIAACLRDNPGRMRLYSFGTRADGTPRTWSYNAEGVAHIGLYPDIYQDLKNLGMNAHERTSFFGAADAFARMWDRIEVQKNTVR